MEITTRRVAPIALAILVGLGAFSSVSAPQTSTEPLSGSALVDPRSDVLGAEGAPADAVATTTPDLPATGSYATTRTGFDTAEPVAVAGRHTVLAAPAPAKTPVKAPKAAPAVKPALTGTAPSTRAATPEPASYSGVNHVWIPALGINKAVHEFPCSRSRPPDQYMYRWGCAGDNNVYLMGHAYAAMKPLHDAYVAGRLKVGMKAYYADASGTVHVFVVKWWKTTLPTTDAHWAWDPQPVSSMTLQTCVGANSTHRLMVRLIEVNP